MEQNIELNTPPPPRAYESTLSKSFGNEYMRLLKDASQEFINTFRTLNNDEKLILLDNFINKFPDLSIVEICHMIDNASNN